MNYLGNSPDELKGMLSAIGVASVRELLAAIPDSLYCEPPFQDDGLNEFEAMRQMEAFANQNTYPSFDSYLGAGAYEHHIPAVAAAVCQKSEFLTAYTPYQAEISQGVLQALYEFQSAVCALTGLDVANSSVYDGANACAEGALMALRKHRSRRKIYLSPGLHPHYRAVVEQYLLPQGFHLTEHIDDQTAGVLIQSPNFHGALEEIPPQAKEVGALTILCANPLAYGLFSTAAEQGADIAVGEMQPFGIPLQGGGPYCGYLACRKELVRLMPGRLVGKTLDTEGQEGYVLTLQTREQHIRREKATSNICTAQSLCALSSLVTLLWLGPDGIEERARENHEKANFLKAELANLPGVKVGSETTFNEFVAQFPDPIHARCRERGILPGLDLGNNHHLLCVTETKSLGQLENFLEAVR